MISRDIQKFLSKIAAEWECTQIFCILADDLTACRYYPLLKPFVHFIPVSVAADGTTDLLAQLDWAEGHPDEVLDIVKASTAFAYRHLAPRSGRDCFTVLLLHEFVQLIHDAQNISTPPEVEPYVSQTPPRSALSREQ